MIHTAFVCLSMSNVTKSYLSGHHEKFYERCIFGLESSQSVLDITQIRLGGLCAAQVLLFKI